MVTPPWPAWPQPAVTARSPVGVELAAAARGSTPSGRSSGATCRGDRVDRLLNVEQRRDPRPSRRRRGERHRWRAEDARPVCRARRRSRSRIAESASPPSRAPHEVSTATLSAALVVPSPETRGSVWSALPEGSNKADSTASLCSRPERKSCLRLDPSGRDIPDARCSSAFNELRRGCCCDTMQDIAGLHAREVGRDLTKKEPGFGFPADPADVEWSVGESNDML